MSFAPLIKKRRAAYYDPSGQRSITVPRKKSRTVINLCIVVCALAIPLFCMLAIRENTSLAEWWTRTIARGYERVLGTLTSFMPVSIFELIVVTLIISGIVLFVLLVRDLCNAKWRRICVWLLSIAVAALYVLNNFVLSMGFGYYRAALPLKQAGANYTAEQAYAATDFFLDDFNALADVFERDDKANVVCPYTFSELNKLVIAEYDRVRRELDEGYFSAYTPNCKQIVNSWALSNLFITGITFFPTGEANLNVEPPPSSLPFTLAHELAHTKGVQREGDASLVARYLLITSDNEYLRYCGYFDSFGYLIQSVTLAGDNAGYNKLVRKISKKIFAEWETEREFWRSKPDVIGDIGDFFNNLYLMFNGADNGTGSYDDGNQTDSTVGTDPSTGEQVYMPVYSQIQKIYFYVYQKKSA